MIKVKDIRDYTERVWFLGTDILFDDEELNDDKDLRLMGLGVCVRADEPEYNKVVGLELPGAFYRMSPDEDVFEENVEELKTGGYSDRFIDIVKEAHSRRYLWIYFHPDILTVDMSGVAETKMTAEELKNKYGGSVWDRHPDYDQEDWQYEADNNETSVDYWTWVKSMIEMGDDD
jgi:hypothetical protein